MMWILDYNLILIMSNKLYSFALTNMYIYSLLYIYIVFAYPKYFYLGWQLNLDLKYYYIFINVLFNDLFVVSVKINELLELLINKDDYIFVLILLYKFSMFLLITLSGINLNKIKFENYFNIVFLLIYILLLSAVISYSPYIFIVYNSLAYGLLWVFVILYFIPKDYLDDKYN